MLVPVLIQVKRECESAINNSINRSRPRDRDQIDVQMPLTNSWEGCTSGENPNLQAGRPANVRLTRAR